MINLFIKDHKISINITKLSYFERGFPETHWRSSRDLGNMPIEFVISFYLCKQILLNLSKKTGISFKNDLLRDPTIPVKTTFLKKEKKRKEKKVACNFVSGGMMSRMI